MGDAVTVDLLKDATTTSTGSAKRMPAESSFQATVAGTGAVSATVIIEATNDGTNYLELGTMTLSGTVLDTDGFGAAVPWRLVRARLTAISGTNATVQVKMGV